MTRPLAFATRAAAVATADTVADCRRDGTVGVRGLLSTEVATRLMQSTRVRLYHDPMLIKEPGTRAPTPWHQEWFPEGSLGELPDIEAERSSTRILGRALEPGRTGAGA